MLLSILASPIERVSDAAYFEIEAGLDEELELQGIGAGYMRNSMILEVLKSPRIFAHLVAFPRPDNAILSNVIERLDNAAIDAILPYLTLIQSSTGANPTLLRSIHLLTTKITNQN
jgi:hypothetical protein